MIKKFLPLIFYVSSLVFCQSDIDNAAKNTGVLPFINFSQGFTPKTVNAKMRVLQGELIGNFNSQARKYQQQGGTNDFLLDFTSVPYIQQFLENKQAAEMDQQAFIEGLESIELPGVGGYWLAYKNYKKHSIRKNSILPL